MTDAIALSGLEIRGGRSGRPLVAEAALRLDAGRIVGLVGASGSGKTLTARSLLGLVEVEPGVTRADLEIRVDGRVLRPYDRCLGRSRAARDDAFRGIRGDLVGYLPQDAVAALNPLWTVARQVQEACALAGRAPEVPRLLERAGLPDARVAGLYPHELSGGMAQRVVIALALARGSRFLVADEPTSALDPTVQVGILQELRELAASGIGVLLITHDLRLLPGLADAIVVMHEGRVVEQSTPEALRAGHLSSPPARRLLEATRRVAAGRLG